MAFHPTTIKFARILAGESKFQAMLRAEEEAARNTKDVFEREARYDADDAAAMDKQANTVQVLWEHTQNETPEAIHAIFQELGTNNALFLTGLAHLPDHDNAPSDNHGLCAATLKLVLPDTPMSDISSHVAGLTPEARKNPRVLATTTLLHAINDTLKADHFDVNALKALTPPAFLIPSFEQRSRWIDYPYTIETDTQRLVAAHGIASNLLETITEDLSCTESMRTASYAAMAQSMLANYLRKETIGTPAPGMTFLDLGSIEKLMARTIEITNWSYTQDDPKGKPRLDVCTEMEKLMEHPKLAHPLLQNPRETAHALMQKSNYQRLRIILNHTLTQSADVRPGSK